MAPSIAVRRLGQFLICAALLGTRPAFAASMAQESLITLLPGTIDLDPLLADALTQALAKSGSLLGSASFFAATDQRAADRWVLVSLVGFDALEADDSWHAEDGSWFGQILAQQITPGNWEAAIQGSDLYFSMLGSAPASLLEPFPAGARDNNPSLSLLDAATDFPWQSGMAMMYGPLGIHDGGSGWKSVDWATDGNTSLGHSPAIAVAARAGTIDYICKDGISVTIRMGGFLYAHLLDNSGLYAGRYFAQGDELGRLKTGNFDARCGYGYQPSNWAHLHWAFPNADLEVEGWTLSMSSGVWTSTSATAAAGRDWIVARPVINSEVSQTVRIAGESMGEYFADSGTAIVADYPGEQNGPVEVSGESLVGILNGEGVRILASEQLGWKSGSTIKSVSETMGLPASQLSDTYYFPWYAQSTWVDTELRIGNVGDVDSSVTVTVGESTYGPYLLHPNETKRPKYAGLVSGPVTVAGTSGVPLVVSERMAWKVAGNVTTVADMIGLPGVQLADTYAFPWYAQNASTDTELRVANVGPTDSSILVTIGGIMYGPYLVHANQTLRKKFTEDAGPVVVSGTPGVALVVSERLALKVGSNVRTVTESLGLPASMATSSHSLPWYANNSSMDTRLRLGNIGTEESQVMVTIGATSFGPFTVPPGQTVTRLFPGVDTGPVSIEGTPGVPLVTSELLRWNCDRALCSLSELMGLSVRLLDDDYFFPWYGYTSDKWVQTELRLAVP